MRLRHLSPVEFCIIRFNTITEFAKAIGVPKYVVCKWQIGTKAGNCRISSKGMIPTKHLPKVLNVAQERGLDIKARDLILGRTVSERE